jgi:hypothetical protein
MFVIKMNKVLLTEGSVIAQIIYMEGDEIKQFIFRILYNRLFSSADNVF